MKKIATFVAAAAMGAIMIACSATMPVTATSNTVGSKVGTSSGTCFLGGAPYGLCFGVDASIKSAAKNGNVSRISTVDHKISNTLNIIVKHETIVTGE